MSTPMEHRLPKAPITVDEYYRMHESGFFAPDTRVELIEGVIVDMVPLGMSHEGMLMHLDVLLRRAIGERALMRVQGSIRLGDRSMPQPDLIALKPRPDYYKKHQAWAADAYLVVEVSDTSLRYDRVTKVPLYARHQIPEVWIIDINNQQVHSYRSPVDGMYVDTASIENPGVIALAALPGVEVDLSDLLRP